MRVLISDLCTWHRCEVLVIVCRCVFLVGRDLSFNRVVSCRETMDVAEAESIE